jgi:hypothetical protein
MIPVVAQKLAIEGGVPVRAEPLPLEFPGIHHINEQEIEAVTRILRSRSLFRYYGVDPQFEADRFEAEFGAFTGAFGLDPADVERRITPHTRGIVMAHMSGAAGDVPAVRVQSTSSSRRVAISPERIPYFEISIRIA